MRSVWTRTAKLTGIIIVVAIRAEDPGTHGATLHCAANVPHGFKQTRARKVSSIAHYRMRRSRTMRELQRHIQGIAGEESACRHIAVSGQALLVLAGAVASQAILILIGCGGDNHAIQCHTRNANLRWTKIQALQRKDVVGCAACELWQSAQVVWRFRSNTTGSFIACGLLASENGWPCCPLNAPITLRSG